VSHEWEAGFDAGLLDERVSLTVTCYHQTTRDALLNRPVSPSLGFSANQLVNVGEIRNDGVETSLSATVAETDRLRWAVDLGYAYNRNEVVDMGGVAPFTIDRFGSRVVEGYPLGGKWQLVSVGTAENGMPIRSDSAVYVGSGMPAHTGSFGSSLSYGDWELFGNAQWAAGQVVTNNTLAYQVQMRTGEEYFRTLIENDGNASSPEVAALVARSGLLGEYTEDADWLKLRELGVRYSVPAAWARRMGATRAALGVSARNLLTLTPYSGADPEVSATVVPLTTGYEVAGSRQFSTFSVGNDFFTVPQARQLVMSIDVQF
jgi:TonB-dependent starch-binding outer membrane protein SusC